MNIEQEIQNILDRNFTRGDNANALKELLVLYNVVGQSEQLPSTCIDGFDDDKFCDRSGECEWCKDIRR
jgi:hypothetical protein